MSDQPTDPVEEETPETEEPTTPEGDSPKEPETPKEPAKEPEKDPKEHNRKGYEKRQQQKAEPGVSQEAFDDLRNDVDSMKGENDMLKFQKANPWCTDDLYKSLDAEAKGLGKTKEQVMEDNPAWKNYVETHQAQTRVSEATPPPSTITSPAGSNNYADMSLDDISKKADEVKAKL